MSEYPAVYGCLWTAAKWFVGLTAFFVASEILERALGVGHYWTGALICAFLVAGYIGGRLDARRTPTPTQETNSHE